MDPPDSGQGSYLQLFCHINVLEMLNVCKCRYVELDLQPALHSDPLLLCLTVLLLGLTVSEDMSLKYMDALCTYQRSADKAR